VTRQRSIPKRGPILNALWEAIQVDEYVWSAVRLQGKS